MPLPNQNNQNNHHPKPFQYAQNANPLIEPQAHLIALPSCPVAACHQLTLWGFLAGLAGQLVGAIAENYPSTAIGFCIPILGLLLYLFWYVCHDSEWRLAAILRLIVVILGLVIGA
jgi:hypothetical protein